MNELNLTGWAARLFSQVVVDLGSFEPVDRHAILDHVAETGVLDATPTVPTVLAVLAVLAECLFGEGRISWESGRADCVLSHGEDNLLVKWTPPLAASTLGLPRFDINQIKKAQQVARYFGHQWSETRLPECDEMDLSQVACATYATTHEGGVGWGITCPNDFLDGSIGGTTGTGRTHWRVHPDLSITGEISRPSGRLFSVKISPEGDATIYHEGGYIFERHMQALEHLLTACGAKTPDDLRSRWLVLPDCPGESELAMARRAIRYAKERDLDFEEIEERLISH